MKTIPSCPKSQPARSTATRIAASLGMPSLALMSLALIGCGAQEAASPDPNVDSTPVIPVEKDDPAPIIDPVDPQPFSAWVRNARVGGAAVRVGMTKAEIDQMISRMVAQNVSVIEADFEEGLSRYRTEAEFDGFLETMRQLADAAHASGLKIVLYYASLEVLTTDGVTLPNTMAKDHPDWVQVGLGGVPNVAYGGTPTTPWVAPGMEDAWMSPNSPYKDIYYNRVTKIASTGLDGIWVDVPLYAAWGTSLWNDISIYAAAKFKADTGYLAPTTEDWSDPAFRRWIAWRHRQLRNFIAGVAKAGRPTPQSEFVVVVETLPTDYTGSTIWGLEGADLRSIEGVICVYEVSTLSVNSSMRKAREDDWISYISIQKYIKAASGNNPAWSFAYAKQPDDAQLVAATVLAARNNVYEVKQPEMAATVDPAYRTNLFNWIRSNEEYLHNSQPAARVGLLYSTASRDYVDQYKGLGQFATTNRTDDLWWESEPSGSAYQLQYVAELRGMVKLLVHNHIPFEVIVNPTNISQLAKYQTVIWPDGEAISDAEAQLIKAYVSNGGHLIATGPNPSGWNEYGSPRQEYALSDVLGISKGSSLPSSNTQSYGTGASRFFSDLLGKSYFTNAAGSQAAAISLLTAIHATSAPWLTTNANKMVHMELSQNGDNLILQYVNAIGMTGSFTVIPTSASTTLKIPAGKEIAAVNLSSPDHATPALSPLAYTQTGQDVSFTVPIKEYAMVVVSLKGAAN